MNWTLFVQWMTLGFSLTVIGMLIPAIVIARRLYRGRLYEQW